MGGGGVKREGPCCAATCDSLRVERTGEVVRSGRDDFPANASGKAVQHDTRSFDCLNVIRRVVPRERGHVTPRVRREDREAPERGPGAQHFGGRWGRYEVSSLAIDECRKRDAVRSDARNDMRVRTRVVPEYVRDLAVPIDLR